MIICYNQTSWLDLVSRILWKVALQVCALPTRQQTLPCLLFGCLPREVWYSWELERRTKLAHKTLGGTKDCTILYWVLAVVEICFQSKHLKILEGNPGPEGL